MHDNQTDSSGDEAYVDSKCAYPFEKGEYEWVEKAALENLKGRRETADVLAKEAATTLTVLLAGAGGSWAYAIKLLDTPAQYSEVAALAAAVWLTILVIVLVLWCLKIEPVPAVYNQPSNLLGRPKEGKSFAQWRYEELEGIQVRIGKAIQRNNLMAKRLNRVRVFATLTPILALIVVALYATAKYVCR